jgi:hypothetical protein
MANTACWVLTNDIGDDLEQDGTPHFSNQKRATEYAADENAEVPPDFKPRQISHLCITVECACCEYVFDEGGDGVVHWENLAEARKGLKGSWEFTDGVGKCEVCVEGPCDAERGDHG